MSDRSRNRDAISELLKDATTARLVAVINLTSHSILELLEYGFDRADITKALEREIVEFDKPLAIEKTGKVEIQRILATGDYYFELLGSKIRLAKLGLFILEVINEDEMLAAPMPTEVAQPQRDDEDLLHGTAFYK